MSSNPLISSAISGLILAAGAVVSPFAMAGDSPGAKVPASPRTILPYAGTYVLDEDNEDNAGSGNPDGDFGGLFAPCVFKTDSIHPIEYNIFVPVGGRPTATASLYLSVWDVDESSGEVDEVYFNGTYLGTLTGADDTWSNTTLPVPASAVREGNNLVQIQVDTQTNGSWCVANDLTQLIIDAGGTAEASCRYIATDATQYGFGETVIATTEVDSTQSSQEVRVEVNLKDPAGNILDGGSHVYTTQGTANDPFDVNFMLPSSGAAGLYSVEALVFDEATSRYQDSCSTPFQVGSAMSENQLVYTSASEPIQAPAGSVVTAPIDYDTTDHNPNLSGIGFRVHFDSSRVTYQGVSNLRTIDLAAMDATPQNDVADYDNDPTTDQYLGVAWASANGTFTGAVPARLMDMQFQWAPGLAQGESTDLNFSPLGTAAGYGFSGDSVTLAVGSPSSCGTLDVDGNGDTDALTDGLLAIRYLFGFTGSGLIDGAVGSGCTRCTAAEIIDYLEAMDPAP